uniref:AlNc14C16G1781 protein n=1 Tax=Albugo laibachii Nc14 TaxID=890382 RepID=F0W4B0_9STRA|nr:AlNc14C16G1781 [Albugo laibachii Nc14]|eukprot:CCA15943.1 AlNc14C16G1781 [Albugo laibachii Nc14]
MSQFEGFRINLSRAARSTRVPALQSRIAIRATVAWDRNVLSKLAAELILC